jgi:site-specific DNA-methyltransferase (adenine-specific)
LFGSQPFTSALVMSNPRMFKYEWIWEKSKASNFVHANHQPLKAHENILVFSQFPSATNVRRSGMAFFPVLEKGNPYNKGVPKRTVGVLIGGRHQAVQIKSDDGNRYPRSVQYCRTAETEGGFHPTQKPVDLLRYLVRTYTQEGEAVLDFTMGSGSTGVAALLEKRKFIGIEKDAEYFAIAEQRILDATSQATLF